MTQATLDYVTLPNDGSNTGAKTPTMAKVIGVNTLEYPLVILAREQTVRGVYRAAMTLQSVQAAAQNATASGFLWISCPSAVTTRAMRLRKATITFQHSAATAAMNTIPRIGLARYTFTGTASGATLAGAKCDPDAANPSIDLRTAVTGMTVTLNTDPGSLLSAVIAPPTMLLTALPATGLFSLPNSEAELVSLMAEEDEWPIIKAGQGLCIYQLDAGSTTDLRRFCVSLLWDEIEL